MILARAISEHTRRFGNLADPAAVILALDLDLEHD